jgi:hypothetical protein
MTRKDFEVIAATINAAAKASNMKIGQKIILVERMAETLAKTSPRFNISEFREACNAI